MSITSNYGNYGYYNNFIKENESGSVQAESKKPIQAPIAGALPTQSTERSVGPAPQAAVYEKKSDDSSNKAAYEIARKSPADRAAIVQQMKAAEEQQRSQLMAIVQKTLQGQVGAYGKATGSNMWQQLAGGNIKVDAATRAQAQKDISEDGYYGVKQTSQRLFDFAAALAGDDVDKMKEMQKAMEKGFKQAIKTWGRELPAICKETMNAANKLFEDYYSSKEQVG
ncbi:hypothetical protein [Butyrivibrio proteoclasticus]|nr:hypothetical protein [Butyrivibrio proteoclasticus]